MHMQKKVSHSNLWSCVPDKPFNPLINSGALLSAAILLQLVKPELDDLARKYEYVHNIFDNMAGGELVQFNNTAYLAAKSSVDRSANDFCGASRTDSKNECYFSGTLLWHIS